MNYAMRMFIQFKNIQTFYLYQYYHLKTLFLLNTVNDEEKKTIYFLFWCVKYIQVFSFKLTNQIKGTHTHTHAYNQTLNYNQPQH